VLKLIRKGTGAVSAFFTMNSLYNWYNLFRTGLDNGTLAGDRVLNDMTSYLFSNWIFGDVVTFGAITLLLLGTPWFIRKWRQWRDAKEQRIINGVYEKHKQDIEKQKIQ
jgi:hypothetical protein